MSRRRRHEAAVNTEAWAIPYGDLITLLLAFFVVMYAVSVVNEGRYRMLAESLVQAFDVLPRTAVSDEQTPRGNQMVETVGTPEQQTARSGRAANDPLAEGGESEALIAEMADEVREALAVLIDDDIVDVRESRLWLEVDIQAGSLFATGSAELSPQAGPVLDRVAAVLGPMPNQLHVEGHTDNRPIDTAVFPSNWELSAGRAAAVVQRLQSAGMAKQRLVAVGYGAQQPLTDNDTAFGRRANRRVTVVILADPTAQELLMFQRQRNSEEV
jgi:chemotaxis protein MotB